MSGISALERRDTVDTLAVCMMIGLTLSWGLNGVAAKLSNTGYDPVFLTLVRSLLGGALVFFWCRWRGIRLFDADGTLWPGLLAGFFFGLEFLLIFVGLDYTTAARSSAIRNISRRIPTGNSRAASRTGCISTLGVSSFRILMEARSM